MNLYTIEKCKACKGKGKVRIVNPAALRARRVKLGLSLAEVGRAIGFGKMYLSDIETGRRRPTEEIVRAYLKL
jgi:transcriptional regulator with XRE-family HTH domain